jgi:hypothetical protein
MEAIAILTGKNVTVREWLTYYKNVWTRNTAARLIDVETDRVRKAEDPEQMVEDGTTGAQVAVKTRYEMRKMAVQEGLDILQAADALLALSDEDLAFKTTAEALKVDADMMPKEPVAGDACKLADGRDGVLGDMDGKLVCVEKPAATDTEAKPAEEKKEGEEVKA